MRIEKCDDPAVTPKCSKCERGLDRILSKPVKGGILNMYNLALCPHCHTILGYNGFNLM